MKGRGILQKMKAAKKEKKERENTHKKEIRLYERKRRQQIKIR